MIKTKLLSLCCAMIMLAALFGTGANAAELAFQDVESESWYAEAVEYVSENGIMVGTSKKVFSPDESMTRAQVCMTLYQLEKKPAVSEENAFDDVEAGAWYSDAVNWASENGIVQGDGEGNFAPESPVTREQLAVMLSRYVATFSSVESGEESMLSKFTDIGEISTWAKDAVCWAVNYGLLQGAGTSTNYILEPDEIATRAQGATVLMRLNEILEWPGTTEALPDGTTNYLEVHGARNTACYAISEEDVVALKELLDSEGWVDSPFVEQTPTYTIHLDGATYLIGLECGTPAYPGYSYISADGSYGGKQYTDDSLVLKLISICKKYQPEGKPYPYF